jgi:hypothetical protein
MSSPKAAVKTAAVKTAAVKNARRSKAAAAPSLQPAADATASLSDDARKLAAEIERALNDGRADALSPEAFQALMAALCRAYGAQAEAGAAWLPLKERATVAKTDVMVMASAILRSANLAVFELGMWQSWTGR